MATIRDVDFVVDETLKRHPENQFSLVLARILEEQEGAHRYITSTNGARDLIKTISKNELLEIFAKEIVSIYNYCTVIENTDNEIINARNPAERFRLLNIKCPYYGEIRSLVADMRLENVNSILYLTSNNNRLLEALYIIEEYRFRRGPEFRELLATYGDGRQLSSKCETNLKAKIDADYNKVIGVKNVQVNAHAVNQCVADILSGAQIRNKNNDYALKGNLFATQHVGKKRGNQEDSVLIMTHPQKEDFKLLVVSDGMGGHDYGEEVSSYTVKELAAWFNSLDPAFFDRPDDVQYFFNRKIEQISVQMYKKYNDEEHIRAGATLTGAVVTKNKTIITQIGDSRAYIVKNGTLFKQPTLSLITRDESATWPYDMKQGRPKRADEVTQQEAEDIRFAHGGNRIYRCIGEPLDAAYQSFTIDNTSYDKLFLMSDGASDLLDFEGIKIICKNTPWENITRLLVQAAITKKAVRGVNQIDFYKELVNGTLTREAIEKYNNQKGYGDHSHVDEISEGKDNTTVAGYFRR